PVLRRGAVRKLPPARPGHRHARAGAGARTHRRRTGHAAPRRTVRARLGAEGKAADRAAPALGGAGARRAGPLRAAWQGAGGADGAAARYARAGGARCAVPPGLDRPGRRRPAIRGTAAAIAAGAAHETARTGAFPHLLLLLPG